MQLRLYNSYDDPEASVKSVTFQLRNVASDGFTRWNVVQLILAACRADQTASSFDRLAFDVVKGIYVVC